MTLPNGWEEKPLGQFFEFQSKSGRKAGEGSTSGKYKFFTSSDLQKKSIDSYDYDGEFLIFGTGGGASIHYCNDKFSTSTDCFTVKVKEGLRTKYAYYFMRASMHLLEAGFHGAGLKHVSKDHIKEMKMRFPTSLKTQDRIITLLEKAEQIKNWRKEADTLSKDYLKSVFVEMFGKGDKFIKKAIEEVCKVVSGSTPSTTKKEYWDGDIDWVTPAELEDGDNYYYYSSQRKITKSGLNSASTLFPKDTVMLTTRAPIGKVAIAGKEMCTNQGLKNMICKNELSPIYLYCWLLFNKEYLNSMGVGATFKEISKRIVEKIQIPLPPLPLQQKFASIVEQIEKLKKQQIQSRIEADNLFNSLMQKAFKGELV